MVPFYDVGWPFSNWIELDFSSNWALDFVSTAMQQP